MGSAAESGGGGGSGAAIATPLPPVAAAVATAAVATLAVLAAAAYLLSPLPPPIDSTINPDPHDARPPSAPRRDVGVVDGLAGLVGRTPLVRLRSLSEATGRVILGKAEFMNPNGSVKDRVAREARGGKGRGKEVPGPTGRPPRGRPSTLSSPPLTAAQIVRDALDRRLVRPRGLITEGTVGSTGVSLAAACAASGLAFRASVPDDVAAEKASLLVAMGAGVDRVRPVGIGHPDHFVHVARRRAAEAIANAAETESAAADGDGGGGSESAAAASLNAPPAPAAHFADQFENLANARAHLTTGTEIALQCRESGLSIDAFVCGAGTGGTLAGVGAALARLAPRARCWLADPPGSSLYHLVTRGACWSEMEAEGSRRRHPFDTLVEGVGLNRVTANMRSALPLLNGRAVRVTDVEAARMGRYLVRHEGLFLGGSAALNCAAAVKVARQLPPGSVVVTLLCDGGARHLSRFYHPETLARCGAAATGSEVGEGLEWVGRADVDNRTDYGGSVAKE